VYLVVSYDVVSNRRRARLAKRLKNDLERVQKSVFEGEAEEAAYARVLKAAREEIDPAEDSVRVYILCKNCMRNLEVVGTGRSWVTMDGDEVL
jgi:CRISPR-associated protein Cas2